ncbi:hypothetical protein MKX07_005668 [Trichoderma sp. CBMAI-0711]|nr:hypothetical protein MKX07_005668 [Trichoderma sp. CBMAI-0711]
MPFSASTWNSLGLSVAATFAILGSSALFDMERTAELFSLEPSTPPFVKKEQSRSSDRVVAILSYVLFFFLITEAVTSCRRNLGLWKLSVYNFSLTNTSFEF